VLHTTVLPRGNRSFQRLIRLELADLLPCCTHPDCLVDAYRDELCDTHRVIYYHLVLDVAEQLRRVPALAQRDIDHLVTMTSYRYNLRFVSYDMIDKVSSLIWGAPLVDVDFCICGNTVMTCDCLRAYEKERDLMDSLDISRGRFSIANYARSAS
jgi:hypothetical protein